MTKYVGGGLRAEQVGGRLTGNLISIFFITHLFDIIHIIINATLLSHTRIVISELNSIESSQSNGVPQEEKKC